MDDRIEEISHVPDIQRIVVLHFQHISIFFLAVPARRSHHRLMEHTRHRQRASLLKLKVTILHSSLDRWKIYVILHPTSWNYQHLCGFVLLEIRIFYDWGLIYVLDVECLVQQLIFLKLWSHLLCDDTNHAVKKHFVFYEIQWFHCSGRKRIK